MINPIKLLFILLGGLFILSSVGIIIFLFKLNSTYKQGYTYKDLYFLLQTYNKEEPVKIRNWQVSELFIETNANQLNYSYVIGKVINIQKELDKSIITLQIEDDRFQANNGEIKVLVKPLTRIERILLRQRIFQDKEIIIRQKLSNSTSYLSINQKILVLLANNSNQLDIKNYIDGKVNILAILIR